MTETQEYEYGVRLANGRVQSYGGGKGNAIHAVEIINARAREIGAPDTAQVVRRFVRTVVHTGPWEG